jgi:hypothetical protein
VEGITLLWDFNNIIFRTLFTKDVDIKSKEPNFQIWKYLTFNSIYQSLFKEKDIKEVVLAVDETVPWRKLYFPRFKESRPLKRDKDGLDWSIIFNQINSFVDELKEHIPFKVLKVKSCEADDVIAVLCMEEPGPFIIISNDEDYMQLYNDNVKIYNPSKEKFMVCEDKEEFVQLQILTGQAKNDVFNIKTPSNWGQTEETKGKRKPGFGPAAFKKAWSYPGGIKKWIEDNPQKIENLQENYHRNMILTDFRYIPKAIRNNVKKVYHGYEYPDPKKIYYFFKKNNFRSFLDDYTSVENKLLTFY